MSAVQAGCFRKQSALDSMHDPRLVHPLLLYFCGVGNWKTTRYMCTDFLSQSKQRQQRDILQRRNFVLALSSLAKVARLCLFLFWIHPDPAFRQRNRMLWSQKVSITISLTWWFSRPLIPSSTRIDKVVKLWLGLIKRASTLGHSEELCHAETPTKESTIQLWWHWCGCTCSPPDSKSVPTQ